MGKIRSTKTKFFIEAEKFILTEVRRQKIFGNFLVKLFRLVIFFMIKVFKQSNLSMKKHKTFI